MTENESKQSLWPYLLFLPSEQEARDEFVRSVLSSRVARSVLSRFGTDGPVLQKDLVEKLPHSNKSILSYLSTLRKFGLITTGSTIRHGKRVVYHELTKSGWGLARFYFEGLPSDVEELTAFLLEDYLTRLTTLYRGQGISETILFEIFARMRAKAILEGSRKYSTPAFVLFGASAYNTRLECDKLPEAGGLTSCNSPDRTSGGPTIDLAMALANDGYETSLISSVGNDMDGWNIITNLIEGNIDVGHIVVEDDKRTNESIIIDEGDKGSRTLVTVSPTTALSITSPEQVPWSIVETSKVVYIGEVFVEVAATIAAHAKVTGIPTVYRCSVPYWEEFGLKGLRPVLSQVDTLIISNRAWNCLKKNVGPRPVSSIRKVSDTALVIRQSRNQYQLSRVGEKDLLFSSKSEFPDITERFTANLMIKIADGVDTEKAVEYAISAEN
ncbi:MAG: carbohydrate kinase family protein [Candidatus Thorarchaeota archaeon]